MCRHAVVWVMFLFLGIVGEVSAQQLRADVGLTTEKHGVSVNVDGTYYNLKYKIFAMGRLFLNEPDRYDQPENKNNSQIDVEAAVGPAWQKRGNIFGPIVGFDSYGRVLAGGNLVTKLFNHTVAYLGYGRLATDSDHGNGMRHRLMFDVMKDQRIFLRFDLKTERGKAEHCRLGAEFHTRINKLNLPLYFEPFWNFTDSLPGIRIGTRL
jgi:hypothetical protein